MSPPESSSCDVMGSGADMGNGTDIVPGGSDSPGTDIVSDGTSPGTDIVPGGSTSPLYVDSLLTVFVALVSLCLLTPHL